MDPAANEHPDRLDLERRPNRHVAFGMGIHFCLGHQLARIECKCALKALFSRWPKLQLAVTDAQIRWRERPGPSWHSLTDLRGRCLSSALDDQGDIPADPVEDWGEG